MNFVMNHAPGAGSIRYKRMKRHHKKWYFHLTQYIFLLSKETTFKPKSGNDDHHYTYANGWKKHSTYSGYCYIQHKLTLPVPSITLKAKMTNK